MSKTMPKHFNPAESEKKWYEFWVENGYFHADESSSLEPYSIVIPPPNVTGSLHMGHALNNTLQDILIRYKRMKGFETLWMPGTDHAGIATQNVVERNLATENIDRHQLGREGFIERVWQWRENYGGVILKQLKALGASCDWERERFTMDEGLSHAVREVFVRLYREDLIYQGDYIINWCPRCQTALSDLEVEHHDTKGALYHIRYPSRSGKNDVTVATTRPETMLGDTAVAVNPGDSRYSDMVGGMFSLPLTGRDIPMIADAFCSMEFGTGAVKVTPAHDPNDFEIGERHGLEKISVISPQGTMTADAGSSYEGLDRYECREKLIEDLKAGGFLEKVEEYDHAVGRCYRCQTVIEPIISRQWFVRMKTLAEPAIKAVSDGRVRIVPVNWEKTYFEWMTNIRDWCISRQIWWGHQMPVWTCQDCGEIIVEVIDPSECARCGSGDLVQEEDVLDTWFSSALWPFSTMGWPEETEALSKFYPTSSLVTGFDILFFWVARMIMMGLKIMDDVPFRDVYIHALVRDAEGRKMSKSLGNIIDPLVIIDQYGADAFRFTLAAFAAMGRDVRLAEDRIEGYRHFVNKLWNASKLVLSFTQDLSSEQIQSLPVSSELHNKWMRSRVAEVVVEATAALDDYRFNDYANTLYQFFWNEYCSWYLELAKPSLYGARGEEKRLETVRTAAHVLEISLRLLHPVMPFVTEEVWQRLPVEGDTIVKAPFPEPDEEEIDDSSLRSVSILRDFITGIRNLRLETGVAPAVKVPLEIIARDDEITSVLTAGKEDITRLAGLSSLKISGSGKIPAEAVSAVVRGEEIYMPLSDLVDVDGERDRISRELGKISADLDKVQKKLSNDQFLKKAPTQVVQKNRDIAEELRVAQDKLKESLERLGA